MTGKSACSRQLNVCPVPAADTFNIKVTILQCDRVGFEDRGMSVRASCGSGIRALPEWQCDTHQMQDLPLDWSSVGSAQSSGFV